jgi:hypothetical protein
MYYLKICLIGNNCLVERQHLIPNLFSPEFEITGRKNVREDNMVLVDLDVAQLFGFYASQNISECSIQKDGHDQRCVGRQQETWIQCPSMKLAVLSSNESCFFQYTRLTLIGMLAKILCHLKINLLKALKEEV